MVGKFVSPSLQTAYGTSYVGKNLMSAFMYDVSSTILYCIYTTNNYDVFLNVPNSMGQQFATANNQLGGSYQNPNIPDPDALLINQVLGNYKQCLLSENGAPLMCENGNYLTVN